MITEKIIWKIDMDSATEPVSRVENRNEVVNILLHAIILWKAVTWVEH